MGKIRCSEFWVLIPTLTFKYQEKYIFRPRPLTRKDSIMWGEGGGGSVTMRKHARPQTVRATGHGVRAHTGMHYTATHLVISCLLNIIYFAFTWERSDMRKMFLACCFFLTFIISLPGPKRLTQIMGIWLVEMTSRPIACSRSRSVTLIPANTIR